MKRFIEVTKSDRLYLCELFGCTERMVFKALSYEGHSVLSHRIRKAALERGGIRMCMGPEIETLHDCDGYLRQYFPNGSLLELSKEDGSGVLYHKGAKVEEWSVVKICDLACLQAKAMQL
ncbi:MAG: hypothetical protein J6T94_02860 [Bacteroidaceae bacterium]|nr:hypothetical protein [Bacteroidaceae bacterium]